MIWFNKLEELDLKWSALEWLHQTIAKIYNEETEPLQEEVRLQQVFLKVLPDNMAIICHHLELAQCKLKEDQSQQEELHSVID
jgi:hypothetical protein